MSTETNVVNDTNDITDTKDNVDDNTCSPSLIDMIGEEKMYNIVLQYCRDACDKLVARYESISKRVSKETADRLKKKLTRTLILMTTVDVMNSDDSFEKKLSMLTALSSLSDDINSGCDI